MQHDLMLYVYNLIHCVKYYPQNRSPIWLDSFLRLRVSRVHLSGVLLLIQFHQPGSREKLKELLCVICLDRHLNFYSVRIHPGEMRVKY